MTIISDVIKRRGEELDYAMNSTVNYVVDIIFPFRQKHVKSQLQYKEETDVFLVTWRDDSDNVQG